MAGYEGEALGNHPDAVVAYHRDGCDMGFLKAVAKTAGGIAPDKIMFLTGSSEGNAGTRSMGGRPRGRRVRLAVPAT